MPTHFHRYIPHTPEDIRQMLDRIGASTVEELFESIPESIRRNGDINLPPPLAEQDLMKELARLAGENTPSDHPASFLGGGIYDHHVPPALDQIVGRSEFYTAYTPYQAEISQGTLQGIYEFQTLVCQLLGMEVANASVYDGASAAAEAVLMARRISRGRSRFLIGSNVHPQYRQVIRTYTANFDIDIQEVPYGKDGRIDGAKLDKMLSDEVAGVLVQSPNYFGCVEDLQAVSEKARRSGALVIVTFSEPLAYALLAPPGKFGADIACGEGQSLGIPMSYGGPHVGLFASKKSYIRNLPGRLCGRTEDREGRTGYVLTLATREQHIRREKATSNICTNQALCALRNAVYLTLMGKNCLRKLAASNLSLAQYAKGALTGKGGAELVFGAPTFNEFVLRVPGEAAGVLASLQHKGILGGIDLGAAGYAELSDCMLVSVTEKNTKEEIDRYAEELGSL